MFIDEDLPNQVYTVPFAEASENNLPKNPLTWQESIKPCSHPSCQPLRKAAKIKAAQN